MEIILIILSSIAVIGIFVLIIIFARRNTKGSIDKRNIDELKNTLNNVDRLVEKTVENIMAKETIKLTKEFSDNTVKSQQNLSRFQGDVTEYLSKRIDELNKQLDAKIAVLDKKVDEKLSKGFEGASESMAQVRERLKAIDEAQKQMEGLGKEVVSLKTILEGNQSRGQYGEYQLKMVLNNVFGDTVGCYAEQYTLKKAKDGNDVRADAVVFMPEPNKMIAIDSKFPFSNYKRLFEATTEEEKKSEIKIFASDVKKHITVIKDKYIVPDKTAPEAMMFIPNDGVFAFIHHNLEDVVEYARQQRVILTSPSTLPPMLVTINMVRIDYERAKNAKEISKQLSKLGKDFEMFGKEWEQLSRNLELTGKARERLDSRVGKLTTKFETINSSNLIDVNSETKEINDNNISEIL